MRWISRTSILFWALALGSGCYHQEKRQGPAPGCHSLECERWRVGLDLDSLRDVVLVFHAVHHRYPVNDEGFAKLVEEKILLGIPRDPWGTSYQYGYAGGIPVLSSLGADRAPGGDGADEDLWEFVLPSGSPMFRDWQAAVRFEEHRSPAFPSGLPGRSSAWQSAWQSAW